jgi:hypothetical protein
MVSGPALDETALKSVDGKAATDNANFVKVVQLQLDLIAFAFASNRVRTASLQVGGCNDHTRYTINGVEAPPYHYISHRIMSDGDDGATIDNAVELHHQIDRIHARLFRHLLDRLSMYGTETGTLLDDCAAVWTNDLGHGVSHTYDNVPFVIAGGCGGFLQTGQFVQLPAMTSHNKLFNTLLNAVGVRKPGGEWVDDFGDPELQTGWIPEIVAS